MKKSIGAQTLVWPTPVYLVGTYDEDDKPNIMNAAWGGVCNSAPPCLAVSVRASRHTHAAIMTHRAFTISIPSIHQVKEADFTGIVSGAEFDKFSATGLSPKKAEFVNAPYVQECPLVIELKLLKTVELGTHTQFIGEVLDVKVDPACLNAQNKPDLALANPILFDPALANYHGIGPAVAKAFSVGKCFIKK